MSFRIDFRKRSIVGNINAANFENMLLKTVKTLADRGYLKSPYNYTWDH